MNPSDPAERDAALNLLREQHGFPGSYVFRIVVRAGRVTGVVSAVAAALGSDCSLIRVDERVSSGGKYTAVHLHTEMPTAEAVLDVYEVVGTLDGVLMSL